MKETQLKDALRNIWKQKVSWFAIVVIAMLSVMAYLGINFASHGIARNGNAFYDETHFRDVEIISTLLVTPEDLDAFRLVEGVADVEGVYQTSGIIVAENLRETVDVVSLTERINTPQLLEGQLPETSSECVVEKTVLEALNLSVGDRLSVTNAQGDAAEYLLRSDFLITGVIYHPDHVAWPTRVPGNRDVVVLPKAFNVESLEGCCMKAEILFRDTAQLDRFSKKYQEAARAVTERLDTLSLERMEMRDNEIHRKGQNEIDANLAELDRGHDELEKSRSQLDQGWREYNDGLQKLSEAEKQISEAKPQLEDAWQELQEAEKRLEASQAKLEAAKAELNRGADELYSAQLRLDSARSELQSGWSRLEDAKVEIRGMLEEFFGGDTGIAWASRMDVDLESGGATAMDFWITDHYKIDLNRSLDENFRDFFSSSEIPDDLLAGALEKEEEAGPTPSDSQVLLSDFEADVSEYEGDYTALAQACAKWDAGFSEYAAGLLSYNAGLSDYYTSVAEYEEGQQKYLSGLAEYEDGLERYQSRSKEYEQGLADYEEGKLRLEESHKELEDGELRYTKGLAQYEDGQKRLAEAQARLGGLDKCRWVILDVAGNPGYLSVQNSVQNTADMGMTFALVFVLVGALVIYATVGRIVDEQRRLVGATKALGFYNREIFAKYLGFGVSATVLGMALGTIGGYFGIQRILLYVYGRYHVFGTGENAFLSGVTSVVFVVGMALSSLAVWSACSTLMRSTATSLMQEKAPQVKHRERKGKRSSLSIYSRLILLNMRSDKKRVAVTIVSVAGCCALLVAGFTMRQSVIKALNAQFDEIAKYDMQIRFDPAVSADAQPALQSLLEDAGTDWTLFHAATRTFSVNGKLLSAKLLCGDLAELDRFYARLDTKTGETLPQEGEGVWIHQRIAEMNGLSPGDAVTIYDRMMKPYSVPVAGVFRIYAGQEMILSEDQYKMFFGEEPSRNSFFLNLSGTDAQRLTEAAKEIAGVESITEIAQTRALYQSYASVLNLIALMMVGIAGLMACFILMNLVNMYINQKKRELAIMRVNGFTVREVIHYVLRETVLSTGLGIVLGLGAGSLLGYRVIRLLEGSSVRFMRDIQWEAWLIASLITVVFAAIINLIALRKVRHLKLTDATQ